MVTVSSSGGPTDDIEAKCNAKWLIYCARCGRGIVKFLSMITDLQSKKDTRWNPKCRLPSIKTPYVISEKLDDGTLHVKSSFCKPTFSKILSIDFTLNA